MKIGHHRCMKTYLVGGAVRDRLLGLEPGDNDYVVVGSTPEEMLALGEEGLIPYISSIGLFRTKAKNVIAAAKIIVEQHAARFR